MNVNFQGISEEVVTFIANSALASSDKGKPVKISANATVNLCSNGDVPIGVLLDVRNGYCSVLLKGYCKSSYTVDSGSSALNPALGVCYLSANGSGAFKATSTGMKVLVVNLDTTNSKLEFIIQ